MEQFRECRKMKMKLISLVMDKYQVDFNQAKGVWMIF